MNDILRLLVELSPQRRPVGQIWAALGMKRHAFEQLLISRRGDLADAGVVLHTAAAAQSRQPKLYVTVDGRRVAALSRPGFAPPAPELTPPPAPEFETDEQWNNWLNSLGDVEVWP